MFVFFFLFSSFVYLKQSRSSRKYSNQQHRLQEENKRLSAEARHLKSFYEGMLKGTTFLHPYYVHRFLEIVVRRSPPIIPPVCFDVWINH